MAKEKAKRKKLNYALENFGSKKPKKPTTKKYAIDPDKIDCRNCNHYKKGVCHVISARLQKQHKVFNSTVATACMDFNKRTLITQLPPEAIDKTRKVNVYIYLCPTGHKRFELQAIVDNPLPYCDKCQAIKGLQNYLSFEKKTKMPLEAIERKQQQLKKTVQKANPLAIKK